MMLLGNPLVVFIKMKAPPDQPGHQAWGSGRHLCGFTGMPVITGAGLDPSCTPAGIPSSGSHGEGCWGGGTARTQTVVGVVVVRVVDPRAAAQQRGDPPSSPLSSRARWQATGKGIGGKKAMTPPQGVSMGQVGIPALARSPGLVLADAQQAVVAQADASADHRKAHKAGAPGRAVQVGFAGVEP